MKKLLLPFLLTVTTAAHAQIVTSAQVTAIKEILISKTWKTQTVVINGLSPTEFEKSNNIHNVDIFPAGDRFKFSPDGTFIITRAAGGSKAGIWDINGNGQLVFNPGQNGGTTLGLYKIDADAFGGRTMKRLGMCNVTSLYEVTWAPAQ